MFNSKVSRLGTAAMVVFGAVAGVATHAVAQDKDQDRTQLRDQDRVYGSQLMTQQERMEYANRMRATKTDQEREAYRLEHHNRMQERAREKGVKLPDEPPWIPGKGMGGMGPGGGAGKGK